MTTKSLFLDQFNACYDEENWFKPLRAALSGLTSGQASWTDGSTNHSILQLVHHLIFWNERYLFRFKGKPLPPVEHSEEDITFRINEKDWKLTLKKLDEVMKELQEELRKASDEKLHSPAFKDSDEPWYSVIANINIHNAYHTGQIVYVRKQQGSWESRSDQ